MADISDVEQAIVNAIVSIVYPQGPTQASIIGTTCRIYRGWPNSATLNSDLNAGIVNITVIPDNESGKTTTRYLLEWQYIDVSPGVTASVSTQTIQIGGTPAVGDVVGALVDGRPYAYRVAAADTPGLVAANLCTMIQADQIAVASGTSISIPAAYSVLTRVVHDNSASYEGRRQEKDVRIIFWCPTPDVRDTLAGVVDGSLAASTFLPLPDSTNARMTYRNTTAFDQSQNAHLYRRDLVYTVEYPTIVSLDLPAMLFGAASINGNATYG